MGNANTVVQYGFDAAIPGYDLTATGGPTAGNMGTAGGGDYGYQVTFTSAFGETPANSGSVYGVTTTGSMLLTDIPISSDTGVTGRNIYRTTEGGSFPGQFLTAINDNVKTTYTDITNDSDLGLNPPLTNTAGSYTVIKGTVAFSNPILRTFAIDGANGIDWITATPVPIVDIFHVYNTSPINGVTLPFIDNDISQIGRVITINNTDSVFALNVWPRGGLSGDSIYLIPFPSSYIIPPLSSKSFQVLFPGLWMVI